MNTFQIALIIIFLAGTIPLLTYRWFTLTKSIYICASVIGCITGLGSMLFNYSDMAGLGWSWLWLHTFDLSFSFDSLSLFFLLVIFLICPLAIIYSFDYFDHEEHSLKTAVNFFFTNILIISMALVTAADNILSFALAWEIMSLSSYFLVIYDYQKPATRNAGYLYFIFAQTGAMFIFAAFAIIFSYSGSLLFAEAAQIPEATKILVFFLAFVGFGSKAGVFPFHIWLPHAHPAAPSHISAIMSGVMIKMGIYGIFRTYSILASTDIMLGQTVLVFGMISGVLGVLYALGKHNIKRLLAYHSVENIGIILMGAGLGMIGVSQGNMIMAGFGFAGSLLHVLNHSIFKSLLFLGAGSVIKESGTGQVDQLGGLMKKMAVTGRTFLVGSVSISGLPPFNGFISEFLVYFAAFQGLKYGNSTLLPSILAIISLAIIGGLASFCFTKVVGIIFLGEPRTPGAASACEKGWFMRLPMIILAAACLIIGVFPESFINIAFFALADISNIGQVDSALVATIGSNLAMASRLFLLIFILVTLLRKLLYRGKVIEHGPTWGCGFTQASTRVQYTGTSYARSVVNFFKPFVVVTESDVRLKKIFPDKTKYQSRVDDVAEIGLNMWLVAPLLVLLKKLRWIQHGNIQLYIGYIISTVLVLLLILFV